jgi:hypothetical protein
VVGTLWTLGALAIALAMPDTMELVGYRVGEPTSSWRRALGAWSWRPSLPWLVALACLIVAQLGTFSEFLYYQF